jgi:hypothetical protein
VRDEVLQAEAVEEDADERPLPATAVPAEVAPVTLEARTVAIAAAGGIVAGAATVAVAKAVSKAASPSKRSKRTGIARKRDDVIASRSFLVDVHLLGR